MAVTAVVCLSVCLSVCPVNDRKSRMEGHSKMKVGMREADRWWPVTTFTGRKIKGQNNMVTSKNSFSFGSEAHSCWRSKRHQQQVATSDEQVYKYWCQVSKIKPIRTVKTYTCIFPQTEYHQYWIIEKKLHGIGCTSTTSWMKIVEQAAKVCTANNCVD